VKFLPAQFAAIQRHREEDRSVTVTDLPLYLSGLRKKEIDLNDLFWSLWHRGKCSDPILSEFCKHERNALRVRIIRLERRMVNAS
jgi:hypothetical protein